MIKRNRSAPIRDKNGVVADSIQGLEIVNCKSIQNCDLSVNQTEYLTNFVLKPFKNRNFYLRGETLFYNFRDKPKASLQQYLA